jgi:hypothetical protein
VVFRVITLKCTQRYEGMGGIIDFWVTHLSCEENICDEWEIVGIGALNHFEQELGFTASPPVLNMWPKTDLAKKCFSHPSVVILVSNPKPIQVKLGLQIAGRLLTYYQSMLIATHLEQSNYLSRLNQSNTKYGFFLQTLLCIILCIIFASLSK